MTRFGLYEELLQWIVDTVRRHGAVERAVIYGSRARGDFKNASDIDLAIFGASLSDQDFARLRFELSALPIVFKLDIVHFERLSNPALCERIEREGQDLLRH